MLSVSNYQYWKLAGGGGSPGDVLMEPDDVVCDENLKSETCFQTAFPFGVCFLSRSTSFYLPHSESDTRGTL